MKKSFKMNLRISYNSPVILTFCILCTLIFILDKYAFPKLNLIANIFTVPGNSKSAVPFNFKSVTDYLKLFTHVFGHLNWNHLVGNLSFILLIGPLLEERYGSPVITLMFCVTAFVTGVLNVCLIPNSLLGSSGIAFMLIILASFTSISKNEIPLSFLFVFILFLGSEIFLRKSDSGISVLAHVAGGLCGSMFGFLVAPKARPAKKAKTQNASQSSYSSSSQSEYGNNYYSSDNQKKSQKKNSDSEETVIGTIEL